MAPNRARHARAAGAKLIGDPITALASEAA
jgi:hypothetical protein